MPFPQRKLHRLKTWDYSSPGCYFVTICTRDRRPLLGRIPPVGNGVLTVPQIEPSPIGMLVIKAWETLGQLEQAIEPVEFCLMPNHVHFILRLLPTAETERR